MKTAGHHLFQCSTLVITLTLAGVTTKLDSQAAEVELLKSNKTCTSGENWDFTPDIQPEWQEQFKLFLSGTIPPIQGFAEAITMRKKATSTEEKLFADYWISRTLYQTDLYHIGYNGFTTIVNQKTTPHIAAIQSAALGCLFAIYQKYPSLKITDRALPTFEELTRLNTDGRYQEILAQTGLALTPYLISQLSALKWTSQEILHFTQQLPSQLPEGVLAQALWATQQKKHDQVISLFKDYFAKARPAHLQRFDEAAHQMYARSLFQKKRFEEAIFQLKTIPAQSNEFAHALVEIQWNALEIPDYSEAIGAGVGLQSGGMKQTFAPEAAVLMAMALNELCQFPEALKAISVFRKNYEDTQAWLKQWNPATPLYPQVIAHYKGKTKIPNRIGNEWLRSSLFLSRQDEINLLYKEKLSMKALSKSASLHQKKLAQVLLKKTKKTRERYQELKAKLAPEQELPGSFKNELADLKLEIIHYNRLRNAAPLFKKVLASYHDRSKERQGQLIAQINSDLKQITQGMITSLNDASETAQLIEVEIFSGATNDIIWQNAHPDYQKLSQQLKEDGPQKDAATVWNWGNVNGGLEGTQEIWEDELNSFQANLPDNCTNKEKYLSIKKGVAQSDGRAPASL